ncbi:MAG: hypothetical protein HUU50_12600 [Candidatus Brocadiae bacterium]|nr:hypothetical protein [Candidatus Brocadiia bacterium]
MQISFSTIKQDSAELKKASREFQKLWLETILKHGREKIFSQEEESSLSTFCEDAFPKVMAEKISQGDSFGLTRQIYELLAQKTQRGKANEPG